MIFQEQMNYPLVCLKSRDFLFPLVAMRGVFVLVSQSLPNHSSLMDWSIFRHSTSHTMKVIMLYVQFSGF